MATGDRVVGWSLTAPIVILLPDNDVNISKEDKPTSWAPACSGLFKARTLFARLLCLAQESSFKKNILLIWKTKLQGRGRGRERDPSFTGKLPSGCNRLGYTRQKPGARTLFRISHVAAGAWAPGTFSAALPGALVKNSRDLNQNPCEILALQEPATLHNENSCALLVGK